MRTYFGPRERESLSFWQLLSYSFGGMIGSGWLLGAYQSAHIAGGLAWVSWVLGGVVMLIIGIVMMELGRSWGRDGGLVWWPFNSSGPMVAMVVVAAIWIFYSLTPPSEAAAAVEFGSHWLPWLFDHSHDRLTAAGLGASTVLVFLVIAANLLGLRLITRFTVLAGILKVAVPVLVLGLLVRSGLGPHTPSPEPRVTGGLGGILTAVTDGGVIYTYIGFQAPVDFGGQARNGSRDIPPAVILPIVFGIVFFPLLQVLTVRDGLLGTGWSGVAYDSPYARLAAGIALWHLSLGILVRIDTIISPLGTSLVFTAALTRTIDDISSQQLITLGSAPPSGEGQPRGLGERVPWRVLAISLLISLAFLPLLPDWSGLVQASSVITVFVYAMPSVAHAALIKSQPPSVANVVSRLRSAGIRRHFAPFSFISMTLLLYWADFKVLSIGTGETLALALILMLTRPAAWKGKDRPGLGEVQRAIRRQWPDSLAPLRWLVSYFGGLIVLCGLRQYGPAGAMTWCWHVLALALGIFAFRKLVSSSAWYMGRHPPDGDVQPDGGTPARLPGE